MEAEMAIETIPAVKTETLRTEIITAVKLMETAGRRERQEKVRKISGRTVEINLYLRKIQYEIHIRKTPEEDASDSKEKPENIKKNSER